MQAQQRAKTNCGPVQSQTVVTQTYASRGAFVPPCAQLAVVALASVLLLFGAAQLSHAAERTAPGSEITGTVNAASPDDQRLGVAVVQTLGDKANVTVLDLYATVEDGIVTLEGTVKTSAEKHLASRYAQDVIGIHGVVNAIVVKPALKRPQI